jgi:hypothetical protein
MSSFTAPEPPQRRCVHLTGSASPTIIHRTEGASPMTSYTALDLARGVPSSPQMGCFSDATFHHTGSSLPTPSSIAAHSLHRRSCAMQRICFTGTRVHQSTKSYSEVQMFCYYRFCIIAYTYFGYHGATCLCLQLVLPLCKRRRAVDEGLTRQMS